MSVFFFEEINMYLTCILNFKGRKGFCLSYLLFKMGLVLIVFLVYVSSIKVEVCFVRWWIFSF